MSTGTLRPPRTTPKLQLPVPGDADPADYVTDTGAICDRLDSFTSIQPPYVTTLPASPADGDEIYYQYTQTTVGVVVWHLRYSAASSQWQFLGGSPAYANDPANAAVAAGWTGLTPTLTNLPAGRYTASVALRLTSTAANNVTLTLGTAPTGGSWAQATVTGYPAMAVAANAQGYMAQADIVLTMTTAFSLTHYVWTGSPASVTVTARTLAVRPIWINP